MDKIKGIIKKILTREVILYIVFGVLTTAVSYITFWLFGTVLGVHYLIANIISWICAVLFAYFTNRKWVFETKAKGKAQLKEFVLFIAGRLFSLGVEEFGLWLLVSVLKGNPNVAKLIMQVVVVVLNYVLSKLIIFKKEKEE